MDTVQRYAACVQYDGSNYHGFQSQQDLVATIQYFLEKALSQVASHPVAVICAGRTDTGVHASAQIIHFDVKVQRNVRSWVFGVNANLPRDISLRWVQPVDMEFHARFKATSRVYRYIIYNAPVRHAILRHAVTWHFRSLDIDLMQQAANYLVGKHDFSAFRAKECQAKTPIRDIESIKIIKHHGFIVVEITANAFLHHMVRNIVGTLYPVGGGLQPVEWMAEVLASKNRSQAGVTAAPFGLYLSHVQYDKKWNLPETPKGPFFLSLL